MPGRDARAACNSSMSAARSLTASSTCSFCRSHSRPPSLASVGRLFAPAHVFLHQADLRRRARRASSARGTPAPGAPRPGRSFPAASARGSGRCRGRRGPPGRPRAVPGSCRSPAPSRRRAGRRRSVRRNNSPLLSSTMPLGHQAETAVAACPTGSAAGPRWASSRRAEDLAEPPDLGLGLADQKHLLARRRPRPIRRAPG